MHHHMALDSAKSILIKVASYTTCVQAQNTRRKFQLQVHEVARPNCRPAAESQSCSSPTGVLARVDLHAGKQYSLEVYGEQHVNQ